MSHEEIVGAALELSEMGKSGLDVNDPRVTYTVRSIPGEYSGLAVVCTLHVILAKLMPGQDTEMDLKQEYEEALSLFHSK